MKDQFVGWVLCEHTVIHTCCIFMGFGTGTGVGLWACLVSSLYRYRWHRRPSGYTTSGLYITHTHTHISALTATPDKGKFVTNQCWIVSCRKLYTLSWTGRVGSYILESELFGPIFLYLWGLCSSFRKDWADFADLFGTLAWSDFQAFIARFQ